MRQTYYANTGATVRTLYHPWGTVRYTSGSLPTKYTYTGQYSHVTDFGLLFYNARWYDPALGRFAQADTIVPGAGNPLAFDRYAYVFNSPLNYVDPSGHGACNGRNRVPECDDIADEQGRVVIPGVRGKELADWEIRLLTIAVMGEVMGGEFPDAWISMIAWIYLNRVAYGTQASLYDAVKGNQSALNAFTKKDGLFPMLAGESPESYVYRFFSEYANIASKAWAKVYGIVQKTYQDWTTYGAGSSVDPTHGATDFRAKQPKAEINGQAEFNSWCANNAQVCGNMSSAEISAKTNELVLALSYENALNFYPASGYQWFEVGPISLRGVTFWLFFDDRSARAKGAK